MNNKTVDIIKVNACSNRHRALDVMLTDFVRMSITSPLLETIFQQPGGRAESAVQ